MKGQRAIRQMLFDGAELGAGSSANPRPGPDGEGLYRSLLDSLQTVVFTTDGEGRFTLLNRAWTELTGFSSKESIGRSLSTDLTSAEPNRTARLFAELLAGEREEVRQEFRVLTRTGQALWLDMHARVVRAPDGTPRGCAGTFADVTERRWVEQTSRVFSEQLEARVADRTQALEIANADLESFAYAVSHELRTPLRGILGFSNVLREQLGQRPSADIEAPLTRIEAYSRRMVALIERMLHYARIGQVALRPQMINCAALLTEVVAELQPELAERDVDLAMNADCACWADPVLLRQVFSNLVGNAVKYTRGQRRARVAVDAVRQGNAMVFSVRDNGVGFDPALAGKLFTVFERLHSGLEFEGSGVGLATVKRIVERHGGRIWAEARLNEGATFRFTLPIKEEA